MYKIAGHTMGTPEYTVCEAIELFRKIGIDGAEIVIQDGYRSGIPCDYNSIVFNEIKKCAKDNNVDIICLTPYNSHFNSLAEDLRQSEIEAIKKVIGFCDYFGARFIRIYGGNLVAGDIESIEAKRENLIRSLQHLGNLAAEKGVTLVVENHFNTMAVSAKESASLIREINHKAVKILYDQANLTFTGNEDYEEAISIQQQYVDYMHVKDFIFREGRSFASSDVARPNDAERNVYTRIVGEGIIKWTEILKKVKEHGYNGWLSLEYERRWHPEDIPDAAIGMKRSLDYLRGISI